MLCASGGMSHFTGGYPWKAYRGPYSYGGINEEFDREILDWMAHGDGEKVAQLTSDDLLKNGDIELRSWITLLGAVDKFVAAKRTPQAFGELAHTVIALRPDGSTDGGTPLDSWTPWNYQTLNDIDADLSSTTIATLPVPRRAMLPRGHVYSQAMSRS